MVISQDVLLLCDWEGSFPRKKHLIQTDCTLIGGDSGGPLFNMQGQVVGIHSRIGPSTSWNFHIPVSAFRMTGKNWLPAICGEQSLWGRMRFWG